jgi:hypothetical protein
MHSCMKYSIVVAVESGQNAVFYLELGSKSWFAMDPRTMKTMGTSGSVLNACSSKSGGRGSGLTVEVIAVILVSG